MQTTKKPDLVIDSTHSRDDAISILREIPRTSEIALYEEVDSTGQLRWLCSSRALILAMLAGLPCEDRANIQLHRGGYCQVVI